MTINRIASCGKRYIQPSDDNNTSTNIFIHKSTNIRTHIKKSYDQNAIMEQKYHKKKY